jgi:rsbT co-antagonist protein RsbR
MPDTAHTIQTLQSDITRLQQRVAALEQENRTLRAQVAGSAAPTEISPGEQPLAGEQLRRIVRQMPVMLTACDDQGTLIVWNEEAERITGYSAGELVGQSMTAVMEIIQPDEPYRLHMIQEWAARGNNFRHWEWDIVARDGTLKTLSWSNISRDVPIEGWSSWGLAIDVTERKQATTMLYEAQQMLRLVIDNLPQTIFWKDRNLTYLGGNRQFALDAGIDTPEEVVGKTDFDMPWVELAEQFQADDQRVLATDTPQHNIEAPIQKAGGVQAWLRTSKIPLHNHTGEVIALLGMYEDITPLKEHQQELQTFKALVENAPDAIGVAALDGQLIYANTALYTQFGITDLAGGVTIEELVPPEEQVQQRQGSIEGTVQRSFWRGEVTYQRRDGSRFPGDVATFVIRDADDQPLAVGAIIRDIGERKTTEDELRQSEARNRALLTSIPDMMFRISRDGTFLDYQAGNVNEFFADPDTVIGKHVREVLPPETASAYMETSRQVFASGEAQAFLQVLPMPTGMRTFETRVVPSGDNEAIALVRDITEQTQAAEERAALKQQIIDAQQAALRELSTPLIPIADNVVIMPLIGTIDSGRAQMVLETLLEGVALHQADVAILDITGVSIVDTQVAQALIRAAQAVRLLGAQVILTGIQPQIAQTLVHLGADMSSIGTHGNLQSGIAAVLGMNHQ